MHGLFSLIHLPGCRFVFLLAEGQLGGDGESQQREQKYKASLKAS
jgi:hypothetical protein